MFGERLREARERVGLTQVEFAKAIGASQQTVSRWEKGESYPEVGRMSRIAQVLEMDVNVLTAIRIDNQAEQLRAAVSAPPRLRALRAPAQHIEAGSVEERLTVIEERMAGLEQTMATLLDRLSAVAGLMSNDPAPDGHRGARRR